MDEFPDHIRSEGLRDYQRKMYVKKVVDTARCVRKDITNILQNEGIRATGVARIPTQSYIIQKYTCENVSDFNALLVVRDIIRDELKERFGENFRVQNTDFFIYFNNEPLEKSEIYELWEQTVKSVTK